MLGLGDRALKAYLAIEGGMVVVEVNVITIELDLRVIKASLEIREAHELTLKAGFKSSQTVEVTIEARIAKWSALKIKTLGIDITCLDILGIDSACDIEVIA